MLRPLHDLVVVRRVENDERSKGGIIIPDSAQEKQQEGEVLAVGPGLKNEDGYPVTIDVNPGDRIIFSKWSGTELKIDGEDVLVIKETDIIGVIE